MPRVQTGRRVLVPLEQDTGRFVVGTSALDPGARKSRMLWTSLKKNHADSSSLVVHRWVATTTCFHWAGAKTALRPARTKSRLGPSDQRSDVIRRTGEQSALETLPAKLLRAGVMTQANDHLITDGRKSPSEMDRIERIARPRLSLRKKKLPELLDPAGTPVSPSERPPGSPRQSSAVRSMMQAKADFILFSSLVLPVQEDGSLSQSHPARSGKGKRALYMRR
jgi:hypothetical protein